MSVLSVGETTTRRGGSRERLQRRLSRSFIVKVDDQTDSAAVVLGATDLPTYGSEHPDDSNAIARRFIAEPRDGSTVHWDVTVEYESTSINLPDNTEEGEVTDPTDEPADVEWGHVVFRKIVDQDINGAALVTSAGEKYVDVEEDVYYLTLRVTQIEDKFDPIKAQTYLNSVNNASVRIFGTIFPARTAWCSDFSGKRVMINGDEYYNVTYELVFNPSTWDRSILDAGFYYLSSGVKTRFRINGEDTPEPQLLNGSGGAATGWPDTPPYTPSYRTFRLKSEENFAKLSGR